MSNYHVLDIYGTRLDLATTKREWKALRREHPWLSHRASGVDEPHAYLVGWLAGWMYEQIHAD